MELSKLEKSVEELENTPMFYMSMASKELFHSNFWYWISRQDKKLALNIFFYEISNENMDNISFEREKKFSYKENSAQVDLAVMEGSRPILVIENKLKDFPTQGQLSRIQQSINNSEDTKYLIVSLFKVDSKTLPNGWKYISYYELMKKIKEETLNVDNYYIRDYISFLDKLTSLADALPNSPEYDFAINFNKELYTCLNKIKFWEAYSKFRASDMVYYIKKQLKQDLGEKIIDNDGKREKNGLVFIYHNINNQKATITCEVALGENIKIGVQIEDTQYRKFIVIPENKKNKIDVLRQKNIWFSSDFKSPQGKTSLKYADGKDKKSEFRYQYEKISKDAASYDDLVKQINGDLKYIFSNQTVIENIIL